MQEVRGDYRLADSMSATVLLTRRIFGQGALQLILLLVALVVLELAVMAIVGALSPESEWIPLIAGLAVVYVAFLAWVRLRNRRLRTAWASRGLLDPSPTTYRVEDGWFVTVGSQSEYRFRWSAVSEIARGKDFWCIIGPGIGLSLARRFFTDEAAERSFLRANAQTHGL